LLQNAFFLVLLVAVSAAFLGLLTDFFQPIFWAATFAIIFYPVQGWIRGRVGQRETVAALLTVLLIFCTVIVPALWIGAELASEAANLYERIQNGEVDPGALLRWAEELLPQAREWSQRVAIDMEQVRQNITSAVVNGSQFIGSLALTAGQNAARFTVMFVLMLYLLFFFLRDGEHMLELMVRALPLGDERERTLFRKFAEVARATVKGTLVIGLVQGFLGGLMFWMLGIQGAVFWAVVMMVLSLLPVVGAGLVWGPASLMMFAGGEYGKGAILLVFGVLVISLVDNLLRPILVGRDTKMPDYLVLLSTLGGLTVFGVSGFVIGPVIAALFLTLWQMFEEDHNIVELLEPEEEGD